MVLNGIDVIRWIQDLPFLRTISIFDFRLKPVIKLSINVFCFLNYIPSTVNVPDISGLLVCFAQTPGIVGANSNNGKWPLHGVCSCSIHLTYS